MFSDAYGENINTGFSLKVSMRLKICVHLEEQKRKRTSKPTGFLTALSLYLLEHCSPQYLIGHESLQLRITANLGIKLYILGTTYCDAVRNPIGLPVLFLYVVGHWQIIVSNVHLCYSCRVMLLH